MLKIDVWLNGIGLKRDFKERPAWPPDLFALTGTLIRRSGTYLELFKDKSPVFVRDIKVIADRWREAIDDIAVETVSVAANDIVVVTVNYRLWRWDGWSSPGWRLRSRASSRMPATPEIMD